VSPLTVIRDVLIIIVALESIVAFALLIYVGLQFWSLANTIRHQVPPLISTAQHTASTVEGTVSFMSERALTPAIRGLSLMAAVLRFLQVLFRGAGRRP